VWGATASFALFHLAVRPFQSVVGFSAKVKGC